MATITLDGTTKTYPGDVLAVDHVSIEVDDGDFLVLVGPSGCGKSTLLRMIAGLEGVTEGRVLIDGRDVTHAIPASRDIAMVFQNYALYPHMTVRQNLAYGLRVRHTAKSVISDRVDEVARLLQLTELMDRRPAALSGGQRQRVAMGRAIVRQPQAFLMDEPLSNLDAQLRVAMRSQLAALHARLGTTTVYVTHDQTEAMTLGRRVAVMRDGRVQQIDVPQTLYRAPANLFVAAFIGSPSMNLINAVVDDDTVRFGTHSLPLANGRRPSSNGPLVLGVRPEAFEDAQFANPDLPTLDVDITLLEELGADTHAIFTLDVPPVHTDDVIKAADDDGGLLVADQTICNARVHVESSARAGRRLTLAVDPRHFHFFDAETGARVTAGA